MEDDDLITIEPMDLVDVEQEKQLEWLDGHLQGWRNGMEAGLALGREQGYDDCLYRIKRMASADYDPELEAAIKHLTGE